MARLAHLLKHNRGARLPDLLIAFDTETDPIPVVPGTIEARLRFGWMAVTRRHRGMSWTPPRWRRFTTGDDFWRFVELAITANRTAVLVAHNVGFDFRVVDGFRALPARGWELRGAVIDDPPTILRWRKARRGIRVLDTLNYYRTSLAQVGDSIGLPKLDHDLRWGDQERDDAYCRRDTEIVLEAMKGIIRRTAELDLGSFASTFPGLAFNAFRHRHLTAPVLIDDNGPALELARRSYVGGRTEAFRLGRVPGHVRVYDFVSMYPAVMAAEPVPTVLRGVYRRIPVPELSSMLAQYGAVADVTLETDTADYPLLDADRLLFPVGRFRTVLARPELTHAAERGRIVRVHQVALYDQAVLFASYVAEWWARRAAALAAGDAAEADFCKRMMNALYGKFGQTGRTWDTLDEADPGEVRTWQEIDLVTGTVRRMRQLAGLVQVLADEPEARDSHPAIAATITSAARVRLLAAMEAAGRPRVVYVDTDSLFLTSGRPGPSWTGLEGRSLGELKLERTIRALTIHGLKDYQADGVRKLKGVRPRAVEVAPGVFVQETFEGLKGALARGDVGRQLIRETRKVLDRTYHKGIVRPDGRIEPYRLGGPDSA
jgi:hypothetical protein